MNANRNIQTLRPEDKNPYRQKLHPELFTRLIDGYRDDLARIRKVLAFLPSDPKVLPEY